MKFARQRTTCAERNVASNVHRTSLRKFLPKNHRCNAQSSSCRSYARPVQARDSLPFEPALGIPIGRKNRVKPIIGGASGHLPRFASEELENERVQIRHLG